jgi:hypothetical protein
MSALLAEIERRGISRLCHFTPSRNLIHILRGKVGILASSRLRGDERAVFNPTDVKRLDGHPGHICCSVEYPNAWYFRKARNEEKLFPDWVVLCLNRDLLLRDGVEFCPRNAAAGYGSRLKGGLEGFNAMFEPSVGGARGTYVRSANRLSAVPTDDQAEVLVPDAIPVSSLIAVGVRDREQACVEIARLTQVGLSPPIFIVAPHFFTPRDLSASIVAGIVPPETLYDDAH